MNERGNEKTTLLRAAWIAPMDRPAFQDGGVLIRGKRIAYVGTEKVDADEVVELGDAVLTPGLINAHVHLELSDAVAGSPPPGGFTGWLMERIRQTRKEMGEIEQVVRRAVGIGVEQCIRFGVTTVGDIARHSGVVRELLAKSPLRVVSYGEVTGMAARRTNLEPAIASAIDSQYAGERLCLAITPHAPYSVEPLGYRKCLEAARGKALPLATHLAESADEDQFLAGHTGPFRELWEALGAWDEYVPRFAGGPIRFAESLGLLDYPTLLAHVNYCNDEEMAILLRGQASVVYCPRTHAYFGHPPHRWREMLASGINVAVGTDSCASSPDLNLMEDLGVLHEIAPELSGEKLFAMATVRAAKAIGMKDEVGTLTARKWGDVIAWRVRGEEPLREVLEDKVAPRGVWMGGTRVL